MDFWLKLIVYGLLAAGFIPFILTQVLFCSVQYDSDRVRLRKVLIPGTFLNLLGNGLIALFAAMAAFHTRNPISKILTVFHHTCSWQDINTLSALVLLCTVCAIPTGLILRLLLMRSSGFLISRRGQTAALLLLLFCAGLAIAGRSMAYNGRRQLIIREVCRKTVPQYANSGENQSSGEEEKEISYVVLYNRSELEIKAEEIYLSDNAENLQACSFHNISISANGTYMLTMDYDHGLDLDKKGGSFVYLSDRTGYLLDKVQIPVLEEHQAYRLTGLARDSGEIIKLSSTSPEVFNSDVDVPFFSHESGFYDQSFDLTLRASPGTTIYFSLDCSVPSAQSQIYTEPIKIYDRSEEPNRFRAVQNVQNDYLNKEPVGKEPVTKAIIVRAVAVDEEGRSSPVESKTYFIGQNQYCSTTVISLVADPEDLFSSERGIYVTGTEYDAWYNENHEAIVALSREAARANKDQNGDRMPSFWDAEPTANFEKHGSEWERPASFTVFQNGNCLLSQPVGIRIQGNSTRWTSLKRFSIYSREEYSGSEVFDVPIFGDHLSHSLVLREGTMNALSQILAQGRDLLAMPSVPVSVFINGEFLYDTFLQEKPSEFYLSNTRNLIKSNIAIVKNGVAEKNAKLGNNPFSEISGYPSEHDLSDEENYLAFKNIIDIQSYVDYTCFQVYLANMDYTEKRNSLLWHTVVHENDSEGDSRWRWGLYDMDLIWFYSHYSSSVEYPWEIDSFVTFGDWQRKVGPLKSWPLFSALRRNEDFCRRFVLTYMDLVNTVFLPEHVLSLLDQLKSSDNEIRQFFQLRPQYAVQYLQNEFGLTGTRETVTLHISDPQAGGVSLNTIVPDLSFGEWSGQYYTDYPVTVSPVVNPGYCFSHWIINGEKVTEKNAEIPIVRGGTIIEAVFYPEST